MSEERRMNIVLSINKGALADEFSDIDTQALETENEIKQLRKMSDEEFYQIYENVDATYQDLQALESYAQEVQRATISTSIIGLSIINQIVNVVQSVINMFGQTLPPIWQLVSSIISTIITTLYNAAIALKAGMITAHLALPLYMVAITFGIASNIAQYTAQQNATAQMSFMRGLIYRIIAPMRTYNRYS